MTKAEVAELIRMNFVLYKLGAKPLTDEEMATTINVWYWHFGGYPAAAVKRAFLEANKVCVYPIQPADIYARMQANVDTNGLWLELKDALGKAQLYAERRRCPLIVGLDERGKPIKDDGETALQSLWDGLSEPVRRYLGSRSTLVDMGKMSGEELERYRKAEFCKSVKEIGNHEENTGRLPGGERAGYLRPLRQETGGA